MAYAFLGSTPTDRARSPSSARFSSPRNARSSQSMSLSGSVGTLTGGVTPRSAAPTLAGIHGSFVQQATKTPDGYPMATVGLDTTNDGKANIMITGVDRNLDGIPDILQGPGYQSQQVSKMAQMPQSVVPVVAATTLSSTVSTTNIASSVSTTNLASSMSTSKGGLTPQAGSTSSYEPPTCPRSHVMKMHVMEHSTKTVCSVCRGSINLGDVLQVCMPCEYAVCQRCRQQVSPSPQMAQPLALSARSRSLSAPSTSLSAPTTVIKTIQGIRSTSPAALSNCVYVTLHQAGGRFGGKVRRKTLYNRGVHNNEGYWAGKDIYLFAMTKTFFGQEFVLSKSPPAKDYHVIYASTTSQPKGHLQPPDEGWESDEFDQVAVSTTRPKDWIEGNTSEGKERVAKLLAALKKKRGADGAKREFISIKDICANIELVKQHLPELLKEFPKIDVDGHGQVSLEQLEAYFDPDENKTREYSQATLDEVWEILTSNREDKTKPANMIDLEDIGHNLEYIEELIPALTESFPDIDTDHSCTIERDEFDAFFGDADTWLAKRLQNIIGLGSLKERINTFYWQQRLDRLRRRGGAMVTNEEAIVILFRGSPGTGKTTIGRLLTGLLHKIGVIEKEVFIECQRDELVGDHIGATEKLTAAKIAEAKGGVLFVDEAYRLNSDVFGIEAINGLMKAMTVKGTVMILAGYPKQMDEFVNANPGLKRRITYEMNFPDYSTDDLANILKLQISQRGFQTDVPIEDLRTLIASSVTPAQRSCYNGGIGEHITRHAIFHLNESQVPLVKNARATGQEVVPSVVLSYADIEHGCSSVPMPPVSKDFAVSATRRRSRIEFEDKDSPMSALSLGFNRSTSGISNTY